MAKCSRCGKGGLFLKLEDGICTDCKNILRVTAEVEELEARREAAISELEAERKKAAAELDAITAQISDRNALFEQIAAEAKRAGMDAAFEEMQAQRVEISNMRSAAQAEAAEAESRRDRALAQEQKTEKAILTNTRKVEKLTCLIRSIEHAVHRFDHYDIENISAPDGLLANIYEVVGPTATLDLQCLSMKDLRKRYRQNEKNIQEILAKYSTRYTTKANAAIYKLMVIALEAELQNVLYSIKFGKLEDSLTKIEEITQKYYGIAAEGNQSIAPTLKKFIGEIDFYFQEAVRIEYEYYVQKERAREEQRAIREQMRQEAEDRRALEAEKKKIEKEESKYQTQIAQLQAQLAAENDEKAAKLESRIAELKAQLDAVQEKKEEITTLQNGKAGNVYVISNIGSFGDDVFKIGMTRRLEPQERIDELGSASVPFPFDVHSFIFSDDAVALENKIHKMLNAQRVNKVNLRKEFFRIPLDDLEALVAELAPTAEFRRTILAEQYHQSLSITNVTDNPEVFDMDDE